MEKKILKRFIVLLSSLLLLIPVKLSDACGPEWIPDEELMGKVLMAPESSKLPDFSPFFLSNNMYYEGYNEEVYDAYSNNEYESINSKEWHSYLGKKVTEDETRDFVYTSSLEKFKAYREKLDNKGKADAEFPMLKCGSKKLKPVLTYLEYAYQVNGQVAPAWNDWESYDEENSEDNPDTDETSSLIEKIKKEYSKSKDLFLKQRYVFLLQRLYYNAGNHEECINVFNTEAVKYDSKNSIHTRSMGYKAASLYRLQQYSEANFLYSLMFLRTPEARTAAKWSFHPQEEDDWNKTLQLAITSEEKCAVWLMFGLSADPVKALNEIYTIDPGFAPARLLASRIVNIYEGNSFGEYDTYYYVSEKPDAENDLAVLKMYAQNKLSSEPAYWNLMTAYLYYRSGKATDAQQYISAGKPALSENDELLKAHYTLLEMLLRLDKSTKVDYALQKDVAAFLSYDWCKDQKAMRTEAITFFVREKLYRLYKSEDNEIMMALCYYGPSEYYDLPFAQKMLEYMKQPVHNELETYLLKNHYYNTASLTEAIGLAHLYRDELALATQMINPYSEGTLPGNPFNIRINDCHDCDHAMAQKTLYTKASLVQKMFEMEKAAEKNPKVSAQTYFLLANAFYNITYFGNNRFMYDDYSYYYYGIFGQKEGSRGKEMKNVYDCSIAEKYYMLAYKSAPNKEFEAKCLFMAAKCEQNAYYMSPAYSEENSNFEQKYFRQLRDQYYDTKYFKEIINECGYFSYYMTEHPR